MTNKGFDKDRYYFHNGTLYANSDRAVTTVLISAASDLESDVLKAMEPGTIAHLPGETESYELSPTREWIKVVNKTSGSSSGSGSGGSIDINGDEPVVIGGMSADERVNGGD